MLKTKLPLHVEVQASFEGPIAAPRHGHRGGRRMGRDGLSLVDRERRETWGSRGCRHREEEATSQTEPTFPGSYVSMTTEQINIPVLVPDNKIETEATAVQPEAEGAGQTMKEGQVIDVNLEVPVEQTADQQLVDIASLSIKDEASSDEAVSKASSKSTVTVLDIFSFARHITITPGCTLPVGAEFTKTWKLSHFASGADFDFKTVRLVHNSSGLLGPACKAAIEFKGEDVNEGDEFEVSIDGLKVPNMPGEEMVEFWRFEDEKGVAYGQELRLR